MRRRNTIREAGRAVFAALLVSVAAAPLWAAEFDPAQPMTEPAAPAPAGTTAPGGGAEPPPGEPSLPEEVEPLFVRLLTPQEKGRNDSNPAWATSGDLLAFERSTKERKEILLARSDGTVLRTIYHQTGGGVFDAFLTGLLEDVSYNSGFSWSPKGDRFVFMSNGGTGNYDLYQGSVASPEVLRLTEGKEKDGQADWSPTGDRIVFVSGREGKADLYLMELPSRKVKRLTLDSGSYLYPQWSPDGTKVAVIAGKNENHDVVVLENLSASASSIVLRPLTRWSHDDLRPTWSPDGERLAFYSNFNPENDPKTWSLVVVAADGSDPAEGEGLAGKVRARNVVPDVERGPSWLPDGKRIVYVANDKVAFFPLRLVDVDGGKDRLIRTGTRINHDVASSRAGTIAFRAQVEQWDHLFLTRVDKVPVPEAPAAVPPAPEVVPAGATLSAPSGPSPAPPGREGR